MLRGAIAAKQAARYLHAAVQLEQELLPLGPWQQPTMSGGGGSGERASVANEPDWYGSTLMSCPAALTALSNKVS